MSTFLFYVLLLVCLGIFVRIFWVPLLVIGSILFTILGIIVSAGITATVFVFIRAMCSQGEISGFSTYFMYSTVFYTVAVFIYGGIIKDLGTMVLNFFKK